MTGFSLKRGITIILGCLILGILGCIQEEQIVNPVNPETQITVGNEVGNQAPPFSLLDENDNWVSLNDYMNKSNVVLVFHTGST